MRCSSCSHEIPDAAKFCPHCGASQVGTPPQRPAATRDLSRLFISFILIGIVTIIAGLIITLPGLLKNSQGSPDTIPNSPSSTPDHLISSSEENANPTKSLVEPPSPTFTTDVGQILEESPAPTATTFRNTQSPTSVPATSTSETTPLEVNLHDGAEIVYVPEGEFLMGSDPNLDPNFWGAEGPQHLVYLDSFWIYRTEVTNAMYQACVAEQKCPRPVQMRSVNTAEYFENPSYANYPVIYVTYTHAAAYCHWAGGRLPTEAEWEKAARGTDGRLFPWGDQTPDSSQVNLCDQTCAGGQLRESQLNDGYSGTSPVGNYPEGASPYGALDMAGNVWEWTFDWFQSTFYSVSPYENPNGPVSGTRHVVRGGSWSMPAGGVRVVARISELPDTSLDNLGFRCAVDKAK